MEKQLRSAQKAYGIILEALAHLLAIVSQDQPIADQVLECRLVEERCREHHERVEPAPRLILPCAAAHSLISACHKAMQSNSW